MHDASRETDGGDDSIGGLPYEVMRKKSCSVKRNPSVKEVIKQQLSESIQWPNNKKVGNSVEQPEDDVPSPPPHEDMTEIRWKHKVLRPPRVTSSDYFKKLGFLDGYVTLIYVSDKKAKFPGKSLYALARSWFKKGPVSTNMHNKAKTCGSDDDELKGFLKEFVKQAKAAKVLARMARKNGKAVQKQVRFTSAPCCGKKK